MSQTEGWPEQFFLGRATVEKGAGAGPTLEKAIDNAYQEARGNQTGRKTYRVAHIYVSGDNPISEYTVIIAAPG
jgi:hypothetical protein